MKAAIATDACETIEIRPVDSYRVGTKLDANKTRLGLVLMDFARAIEQVGRVGTFGAQKYAAHGWLSVPRGEDRYMDACLRHLFAHKSEGPLDAESGLPHLSHAAWNLLAVLELGLRGDVPHRLESVE